MVTKRTTLGRGLGALLGQTATANEPEAATPVTGAVRDGELAKLPVDLLQRGKYQPRLDMHQESLQE